MNANNKDHKLKTTYTSKALIENIFVLKTNADWKNFDFKKNPIVDINNNDYFGIRVFEKGALAIIYSPLLITNLKRILKEGKRFPTTHFITFNLNEFDPTNRNESMTTTEWFLKETTKIISNIEEIKKDNLVLNIIDNKEFNLDKVILTLATIYQYKIAITTTKEIENDYINFKIKK